MWLRLERPKATEATGPALIQTILCVFTPAVVIAAQKYLRDTWVSRKT